MDLSHFYPLTPWKLHHHQFIFCPHRSPHHLFPVSFFWKPFIMRAIHNTSPSMGFKKKKDFPYKPGVVDLSYPSTSLLLIPHTRRSLTPRSQCIHSLPFVSAQSKQAAAQTRDGGVPRMRDNWEQRMMNAGKEGRGGSWLKWGNCTKTP